MSQHFIGVIDPETTDGSELADGLSQTLAALLSQHAGASAPTYAVAGTIWTYTGNPALWTVYIFDGTEWVPLLYMNPSTNAITVPGITIGAMGNIILQQPSRAGVLDVLDIGQGYMGHHTFTGSVSSGLGWIDRPIGAVSFTALSYVAVAMTHGRMRHTGVAGNSTLRARIINTTTGQVGQNQNVTSAQNHYMPFCLVMPFNTTPGVAYTINTLFSNTDQDSSATMEGHLDVICL